MDANSAIQALQNKLSSPGCPCRGFVAELQHHFDLRVHEQDRHLWSPTLSGTITPTDSGRSSLHALVSPNPSIWTAVAFSYLACFTGLLFFITFGIVQLMLDQQPWAFFACGGILLIALTVRIISRFGERLAVDQTALLRGVLDEIFPTQ